MLDKPEKTRELVTELMAAVPFEVELTPELIELLRTQQRAIVVGPQQIVSKISHAGDEGGIMCHIHPKETENAIIISITHVRMDRKQRLERYPIKLHRNRMRRSSSCTLAA